ncbi:MAG: hypothetical protein K6F94_05475 [Bacteroidaceae bacterium]|nr:hypothetical protein [Bacteroidaceae bacterium]
MKKTGFIIAALVSSAHAFAGGYLTNTNQNAAFGRNLSQEAKIDITSTYANPAGIAFLDKGWHLALSNQSAWQTRTVESTFGDGLFSLGTVNGVANQGATKTFKGKAVAPSIPSFDLAYVQDKWSLSLHFAIGGGGGKCTFDDGLGSFESQVAMLPALANALMPGSVSGYSFDTYMKGRQYYFSTQLVGTYKVTNALSLAAGVRMVNASCAYEGYVKNIGLNVGGQVVPASQLLTTAGLGALAPMVADRVLDCSQSGTGFTPILGIDWRINEHWNVAAKYEFRTHLRLKNTTATVTDESGNVTELNAGMEEYNNGNKLAADVPAILMMGAQYTPIEAVRLNAGAHVFFDKQATQHSSRHEKLDGPGWEILAGAEWDINDIFTVSAGWQNTNYGLGKNSEFITDMSFVTNSNSVGVGARIHVSKKIALDISYFKTLYSHYKREQADYNHVKAGMAAKVAPIAAQLTAAAAQLQPAAQAGDPMAIAALTDIQQKGQMLQTVSSSMATFNTEGSDNFTRTNDVFGIGLLVDF